MFVKCFCCLDGPFLCLGVCFVFCLEGWFYRTEPLLGCFGVSFCCFSLFWVLVLVFLLNFWCLNPDNVFLGSDIVFAWILLSTAFSLKDFLANVFAYE